MNNQTKPAGMTWAEFIQTQVAGGKTLTQIGYTAAAAVTVNLSRTGHKMMLNATRTVNSPLFEPKFAHRF